MSKKQAAIRKSSNKLKATSLTLAAAMTVAPSLFPTLAHASSAEYDWLKHEDHDLLNGRYSSSAISGDGSHIIVSVKDGGEGYSAASPLFVTSNYGATWQNVMDDIDSEARQIWSSVDVSNNGQTMAAASQEAWNLDTFMPDESKLFISQDAGASWEDVSPEVDYDWTHVAVSGDGSTIAALSTDNMEDVYISEDGGDTWQTSAVVSEVNDWESLSISTNGSKIVVGGENSDYSSFVDLSTNTGDTWTDISPDDDVLIFDTRTAMSADGNKIIVTSYDYSDTTVRITSNNGSSWTDITPEGLDYSNDLAISGDGEVIMVLNYENTLLISGDDGQTWNEQEPENVENEWVDVDLSDSGSDVIVVSSDNAYSGQIPSDSADSDGDGISDTVEDAGPNDGDANDDGFLDSEQHYVSSFVNPVTGTYSAVELSNECTITEASANAEANNTIQDSGYTYASGFINFSADCGDPGYTTYVIVYQYGAGKEGVSLRKFNPNTNAYFTIDGATLSQETFGGQSVILASYEITDGGVLDMDGEENGQIVDPVGLGQLSTGSPNTGTYRLGGLLPSLLR